MRALWHAGRLVRPVSAVSLTLAGVLAWLTGAGGLTALQPAVAATAGCTSRPGSQPPSPGTEFNALSGVTVLSACDAWAVGTESGRTVSRTLIEHWNGSAWSVVRSPNPGARSNGLTSVSATSPTDIWAAGFFSGSSGSRTLILHFDGVAWTRMSSPSPGSESNVLRGVHAVTADDAWAVGGFYDGTRSRTLIEHWNGSSWRVTQSPSPGQGTDDFLDGVTATSHTDAWAVGQALGTTDATHSQTVILHWNGSAWTRMKSLNPGTGNGLFSVAATSANDAWAVGSFSNGPASQTFILRWNGSAWVRVASPDPGGPGNDNSLSGVADISAANALAVGSFSTGGADARTLILRWNGTSWTQVASHSPGIANGLFAVSASSAGNAWTVGSFFPADGPFQALAIHCC